MGDFVTRIHAVGNHGCQRGVKNGEALAARCQYPDNCVDCATREYVEKLQKIGSNIKVASLTHWDAELPGYSAAGEVRDDLLTNVRRGSF